MAPAVPDLAIREGAPAEDDPLRGERYVGPRNGLGQFEGLGKLRYANGETYQGKFLADQQDGRGVHRWPSGASYEGEWIAGGRSGLGKYRFPEGDTYEGRWAVLKKGKGEECVREGARGVYMWPNGESYTGGFKADKREGKGVFVWYSGRSDLCSYKAGKVVGNGVRWSADRSTAWRLSNGVQGAEITLEEAAAELQAFESACEEAVAKEVAAAEKFAADRAAKLEKERAKKKGKGTPRGK
jgi:hypothetical protein